MAVQQNKKSPSKRGMHRSHDFLSNPPERIHGCYFPRRMAFMGRQINHGGIFPAYMLRLFRLGQGAIEDRWMDEHIKVKGDTVVLKGELIDDNLNSLTWWTEKHNKYASREAVDLLNLEFAFMVTNPTTLSFGRFGKGTFSY